MDTWTIISPQVNGSTLCVFTYLATLLSHSIHIPYPYSDQLCFVFLCFKISASVFKIDSNALVLCSHLPCHLYQTHLSIASSSYSTYKGRASDAPQDTPTTSPKPKAQLASPSLINRSYILKKTTVTSSHTAYYQAHAHDQALPVAPPTNQPATPSLPLPLFFFSSPSR